MRATKISTEYCRVPHSKNTPIIRTPGLAAGCSIAACAAVCLSDCCFITAGGKVKSILIQKSGLNTFRYNPSSLSLPLFTQLHPRACCRSRHTSSTAFAPASQCFCSWSVDPTFALFKWNMYSAAVGVPAIRVADVGCCSSRTIVTCASQFQAQKA